VQMYSVVETRGGKLRGFLSNDVTTFKGVQYAAPPFGANRLRPPQPVEPWDGMRDALAFGPKSPQVAYPPGIAEGIPELVGQGEDCLTLNIWTPDVGAARLPVMVWIPGGMFEFHATGATPFYDGSRFARYGVVCVTIGYRVGADYQGKSGHSADIACLYRMTLSPHRALCNFAASAAMRLASTANPSAADQTFVQAALRHGLEEAPPQDVALRDRGPCRPILNGKTTDRRD